MRIFLSILFTLSLLQAQSIDQLIQQSLKTIQHSLSATDQPIEKSQQWANPDLSLQISNQTEGNS